MAPRKLTIDDYEITRDGKVINKHTGHTLAPQPNGKGYLRVSIGKKLMFIHRLVAEKYIPNPENKPQVNHKDGNKLNNCVDNLEWVTNQENRNHAVDNDLQVTGEKCSWAKLTEENVKEIRANPGYENEYWARKFKVSRSTISDVVNYRTWKRID
jgi:hypothetical protein